MSVRPTFAITWERMRPDWDRLKKIFTADPDKIARLNDIMTEIERWVNHNNINDRFPIPNDGMIPREKAFAAAEQQNNNDKINNINSKYELVEKFILKYIETRHNGHWEAALHFWDRLTPEEQGKLKEKYNL